MSDVEKIESSALNVLDTLKKAGTGASYVTSLEAEIEKLRNPSEQLSAAAALRGLSHMRALGDIYLESVPGNDWPIMVSSLYGACTEFLKKNDPNWPTGREPGVPPVELERQTRNLLGGSQNAAPADELALVYSLWPGLKRILRYGAAIWRRKFVILTIVFVAVVALNVWYSGTR